MRLVNSTALRLLLVLISCTNSLDVFAEGGALALEYQGTPGLWMPEEMAIRVLADVETLPLLQKKLVSVETQLELSRASFERVQQLRALEENHSAVVQDTVDHSLEALKVAWEDNERLRRKESSWWRHPALWFGVGMIVTTGLIFTGFRINKISR